MDEKGSGDDEKEGDKKRDARRATDRPGRYCLEQGHPGQGHPGVSGRTRPACGKHHESVRVTSAPQTSAV